MLKKIVLSAALLLPLSIHAQAAPTNDSAGNLNWSIQTSWSIPAKPVDIAQSLDNKRVFILGDNAKIYIFAPNGRPLGVMPVDPGVNAIDISARGDILYLANEKAKTYSAVDISFNQNIDITGAPVRGKIDAPVTLVLFSDFECPWCGRLEPVLTELLAKNQDKLRIVFKHMPLPMHQYAENAALAAIAAQRQGKFWEMHDILFQIKNWTDSTVEETAQKIGLNMEKFHADLVSPEVQAQLAKDATDAQAADITATPSLFINTKPVRDRSLAAMQQMVDEALAAAGAK
ncbi:MAG: thioredoxin domain-containing protein [Desulfobulbus sp.]|nr:thioredoxin domain-containing protein [Desulfobulbus sp.]